MPITVPRQDSRFQTLVQGHNLRFPADPRDAASRILICQSPEDAAAALQAVVSAGMRPTVRSGGHCYEDFVVNNPNGAILDVSLLKHVGRDNATSEYIIQSGAVLGDAYAALYKQYNVTLPGGSCYTVGAGGHISGGGYGLLSRMYGLTSDWLTAVDIVTVDADGKVLQRRVDSTHDADLFRALRGGGGSSFGVITAFRFAALPAAPAEVAVCSLDFPWTDMTEAQFTRLMTTYGNYWETRGCDPDTWGLFVGFEVGERDPDGRLSMHIQFCQPDGTARDLTVLNEFLDRMRPFGPQMRTYPHWPTAKAMRNAARPAAARQQYHARTLPWLDATLGGGGGFGGGSRAKYKSAYMKRTFTPAECAAIYRFYSSGSLAAGSSVISMDSYGGAINKPQLAATTAVPQRASVMKLQWQCYWRDAAEDPTQLKQLDAFYTSIYTGAHVDPHHQGTPWGERYEGCYMNYPDVDMLRYPYWPQLFYGQGDVYPHLQRAKSKYDPHNIFHHTMSIQAG